MLLVAFWCSLGLLFGLSCAAFWPLLGLLGCLMDSLGPLLDPSRAILEPSWACLGASWRNLGLQQAFLGDSWPPAGLLSVFWIHHDRQEPLQRPSWRLSGVF